MRLRNPCWIRKGSYTSDFDYDFPRELIAQRPLSGRAESRLLILQRKAGSIQHARFTDFAGLPDPGDVLVLNESRVIQARLIGIRDNGREAEVLLVHPEPDGTWLAMVHPGGKLKQGRSVRFGSTAVATIEDVVGGGLRKIRFTGVDSLAEVMRRFGKVPLPPYIEREPDASDQERYQTVYARADGSVAAPTAGLHFTADVLSALRGRGVVIAPIVLHVGPGTFKPVETEDITQHPMHAEWYEITEEAARTIEEARRSGRRVWAVGTTSARVLEAIGSSGSLQATSGWTDLFIHPPYDFKLVDALLTNFHLPRSTLLMLVSAFAGHEATMAAYREAVRLRYRLYSYGDAMVVM